MEKLRAIRHWIVGGAVALGGAACARFAPHFVSAELAPFLKAGGSLLALAGLFLVSRGIRRRMESGENSSIAPCPEKSETPTT